MVASLLDGSFKSQVVLETQACSLRRAAFKWKAFCVRDSAEPGLLGSSAHLSRQDKDVPFKTRILKGRFGVNYRPQASLFLLLLLFIIIDSCHLLSRVYILHVLLGPLYTFSYLILVLFTFYGVEDFEGGEDKTLIKVTQAVSEEAKNPSQASLAPELVFITSVSPRTEGKNTLITWY